LRSIIIVLGLAVIGITLWPVKVSCEEPIKVGVSLPLTGEGAAYGMDVRNGIEYARDVIAPGKYDFIFEDDKCTGLGATTVAHKLIDLYKVKYVIGFACSGALISAAPIYEKAKVVVIASSTSSPSITNAGDYIFRVVPSDLATVNLLYDFVQPRQKHVGIISEETEYCLGFAKAFEERNGRNKNPFKLSLETFAPGSHDFRSLLGRIRSRNVDALFLNPQGEPGLISLVKEIRDLKWDVPIYAIYYPASPTFLKAAGPAAEGIVFADMKDPDEFVSEEGRKLWKTYLGKYGSLESVPAYFFLSFNNFVALHQAIERGGDVKRNLYEMEFVSPLGMKFRFDQNGDYQSDLPIQVFRVIRGGKPVLMAPGP